MFSAVIHTVPMGRCRQKAPSVHADGPRALAEGLGEGCGHEEYKVISSVEEDDGGAAAFVKSRYSRDEGETFPCSEGRGAHREVLLREEVLDHVLFSDGHFAGIVIVGYHKDGKSAEFDGHQHRDVVGSHSTSALGVGASPVRCGGLREASQQRQIRRK